MTLTARSASAPRPYLILAAGTREMAASGNLFPVDALRCRALGLCRMRMKKPSPPFLGSTFAASPKGCNAALFGAPHGTPYRGIDNRPYAA